MNASPTPSPLQAALERLAQSRLGLRAALLPAPGESSGTGLLPRRLGAWLRAGPFGPVARTLDPWFSSVQRTFGRWWRRHPWRTSAVLASNEIDRTLVPWARRHPLTAVGLGAAAGVALATAAPWRWASSRQVAASGGRRARRWLVHQFASPVAQTVLAGAVASILGALHGAADQTASAPSMQDAPPSAQS